MEDVLFVAQKDVKLFLSMYPDYQIAQKHAGNQPFIMAKKKVIDHIIKEETEKAKAKVMSGKADRPAINIIEENYRKRIINLARETQQKMEKEWHPSSKDLAWIHAMINKIKIGGIWGTSYATYKRTGEKEMTLINTDGDAQLPAMTDEQKKENRERTEKAIKAIGWTYSEDI